MTDNLEKIYGLQADLQAKLDKYPLVMTPDELQDYIRLNCFALIAEVIEAADETNWKTWVTAEPGIRDRERYLTELADCLHFLLNLYLAAGASAEEIVASYEGKNLKNHQRQEHGYTGLDKCATCRRELDVLQVHERVIEGYGKFRFCTRECSDKFQMDA